MNICYFGDYDQNYSRHKILLRGLKENKADTEIFLLQAENNPLKKYWAIFKAIRKIRNKYDIFFVAYSNSRFVWFVRLLISKPIVWDPFYSLYDNWVFDRKLARPGSYKAGYYWFLDWICCKAANLIVIETNAQIEYFVKEFHNDRNKFIRVLVGADDSTMFPRENRKDDKDDFTVFFYGTYIPVQGADVLVRAAKLLEKESVSFIMLGQGQDFAKVKKIHDELGVNNITFIPKVPFEELPGYIAKADACFGLLSSIARGERSIPNKIYDAVAMGKACISADTVAMREIFQDQESIILFKAGDHEDLAKKILLLKENAELREKIGQNALRVFQNIATPGIIGKALISDLRNKLNV